MHIHGNQINLNGVNPYSAAAEKALAAQRAADVRRKLTNGASDIEGVSSPDEAFMVAHWMGPNQGQVQGEVEYRATVAGKESDFG